MSSRGFAAAVAVVALGALAASCASLNRTIALSPIAPEAHVGRGWSSDSTRIDRPADEFRPNETVFAVVDVPDTMTTGTLTARWVFGGTETVGEQTVGLQQGANVYAFRLTPPAGGLRVGAYRFEVHVNGREADRVTFTVVAG